MNDELRDKAFIVHRSSLILSYDRLLRPLVVDPYAAAIQAHRHALAENGRGGCLALLEYAAAACRECAGHKDYKSEMLLSGHSWSYWAWG